MKHSSYPISGTTIFMLRNFQNTLESLKLAYIQIIVFKIVIIISKCTEHFLT